MCRRGSSFCRLWLAATPTCLTPRVLAVPHDCDCPKLPFSRGLFPPWGAGTAWPSVTKHVKLRTLGRRAQKWGPKATEPMRPILALRAAIRTGRPSQLRHDRWPKAVPSAGGARRRCLPRDWLLKYTTPFRFPESEADVDSAASSANTLRDEVFQHVWTPTPASCCLRARRNRVVQAQPQNMPPNPLISTISHAAV